MGHFNANGVVSTPKGRQIFQRRREALNALWGVVRNWQRECGTLWVWYMHGSGRHVWGTRVAEVCGTLRECGNGVGTGVCDTWLATEA